MSSSSIRARSASPKSTSFATLDDDDNLYLEEYLSTGYFSVSPIYQPTSPDFSGVALTVTNEPEPTVVVPTFTEEDKLHAEKRIAEAKKAKELFDQKRVDRQKRKAELQFDVSNPTFDLSNFHLSIFEEPEVHDFDLSTNDEFKSSYDLEMPDPVTSEKLIPLITGYVAPESQQNRNVSLTSDHEEDFSKSILSIYEEKQLDPDVEYLKHKKYDENLFRDRRLMQLIQYRNRSDPNFIKNHFPIEDSRFFDTDVSRMFDMKADYLIKIKNQLQALVENTKGFKSLFYGSNWFHRVKKVLESKDHRRFSLVLIATMYLVFDNKFISDFNSKLIEIDEELFRNSIFKNLTVYSVFNHLGIIFVNQFCQFNFYRPYVLNLIYSSHVKTLARVELEQRRKKKKIENIITSDDVLESFSNNLFPSTAVDRKGTGFRIKPTEKLSSAFQELSDLKNLIDKGFESDEIRE